MTSDNDVISVRANFWRGDRAIGGRLSVDPERLHFKSHGLERSLGGDEQVDITLRDISHLSKASRSLRVPRARLIVRTTDGQDAYFLVPKLEELIGRLTSAVQDAGGDVRIGFAKGEGESSRLPELRPDDSVVMNWAYSGWTQVAGLVLFSIPLLVALLIRSRNPVGLALVAALIIFQTWRAWAGFRRKARLNATRRGP